MPYRLAMAQRPNGVAVPTGLEPAISCVTGRRVNHYTTGPQPAGNPPAVSDPYGIRTRVTAVKGRCLNHLTNGPRINRKWRRRRDLNPRAVKPRPNGLANRPLQPLGYFSKEMAPQVGFEPTTYRLTAGCSTAELLRNGCANARCLFLCKFIQRSWMHRGNSKHIRRCRCSSLNYVKSHLTIDIVYYIELFVICQYVFPTTCFAVWRRLL